MPKTRRLWNFSILLLVSAGLLVPTARTIADLDLWGHVNWGKEIVDRGQVPRVDPYSYLTAGQPWINHEWLGDVSMGLAWLAGGPSGLLLLKLIIWLSVLGLVLVHLLKTPLPPLRAGLLMLIALPILTAFTVTIRPQAYTALAFTLLLLILQQVEDGRPGWLWALPALFLAWANLHGAWLAGLGLAGIWAVVFLLTRRRRKTWLQTLPPLILSGVVTLVNPYGLALWENLLSHLSERRLEITEWHPLEVHSLLGGIYLVWLALCLLGVVFSRRSRSPGLLSLLAVCVYLPLVSARHLLFFSLAALLVAGRHIGTAWERWLPSPPDSRPVKPWLAVLPALLALLLILLKPPNLKSIPFQQDFPYPVQAVALLQESGVQANLAVHYNWGHYVSWHLAPEIKVSVDTRREQVYPSAPYNANLQFMTGAGAWAGLLDDYPTDLALTQPGQPSANLLLLREDWEVVYQDDASLLFARRGSPLAEQIKQTWRSSDRPLPVFP